MTGGLKREADERERMAMWKACMDQPRRRWTGWLPLCITLFLGFIGLLIWPFSR